MSKFERMVVMLIFLCTGSSVLSAGKSGDWTHKRILYKQSQSISVRDMVGKKNQYHHNKVSDKELRLRERKRKLSEEWLNRQHQNQNPIPVVVRNHENIVMPIFVMPLVDSGLVSLLYEHRVLIAWLFVIYKMYYGQKYRFYCEVRNDEDVFVLECGIGVDTTKE